MLIRVFLISSNCLLLEGLVAVIASRPDRFALVGSAASPEEAGSTLVTAAAQVVLLDVDDGRGHIPVLIEEIKAQCGARILFLTGQDDGSLPGRAAALGARGVIDRLTTPGLLLRALEKVHEGQLWLDRATTERLVTEKAYLGAGAHDRPSAPLALLTERERKVLAAVVHHGGESGKAIALKLHIGESTLRNHLTSIYQKFDVPNRNGLLAYAVEAGLIERLAC
ncbi:MAG: response regulator transcription factor [Ramlibacter sp.]|nr:response regulator transcription factor [Ramlibacter sp.]